MRTGSREHYEMLARDEEAERQAEQAARDYLAEAREILAGKSILLPEHGHLDALAKEKAELQASFDLAYKNLYGPGGHVDLLKAADKSNAELLEALNCCVPWLGKMIADGGHLNCVAPNAAVGALARAEAAITKAKGREAWTADEDDD